MKLKLGGSAVVLAVIVLLAALGGGAVAAGIVPLARHALTAGTAANALRLGGKTPAQLRTTLRGAKGPAGPAGAAGPAGPAATALASVHTTPYSQDPATTPSGFSTFTATCPAGQKATGGGNDDASNSVIVSASHPTAADDGWTVTMAGVNGEASTGSIYVVCLG